jgi:hypothetical protein
VDVVSLGDHLGPHQQVNLPRMQTSKQPFHVAPAPHRIAIHSPDARLREDLLESFFALLRSGAKKVEVFALTLRAFLRNSASESTVMALQSLAWLCDRIFATDRLMVSH